MVTALYEGRRRRLVVARVVWAAFLGLVLTLFVLAFRPRVDELTAIVGQMGVSLGQAEIHLGVGTFQLVTETINALGFVLVGLLIFWRQSDELFGIFVSLFLITFGASGTVFVAPYEALLQARPGLFPLACRAHARRALGLLFALLLFVSVRAPCAKPEMGRPCAWRLGAGNVCLELPSRPRAKPA